MNEYQWAEYELMTTDAMLSEELYKEVYDVVWCDVLLEYRLQCRNLINLSQTTFQLNINTTNVLYTVPHLI